MSDLGLSLPQSHRERALLSTAGVFVVLNRLALALARGEPWTAMWGIVVWAAVVTAAHLVLNRSLPHRDPFVLPVVALLGGWGITLVARLAPAFADRQVIWFAVGMAACLTVSLLPANLRVLWRYRYTWLMIGLVLLGATILFGVNPTGNVFAPQRWLGFGDVFFQPSELLKLLLVIFLASYLTDHRAPIRERPFSMAALGPLLLMWGLCVVLLVWQRDLGAASLFFMVFLAMLYASTGHSAYVLLGIGLLLAAGVVGYQLFDVVQLRIDTWWNPWPEADNRAFQIVQSLLAVASGGVFGSGVGLGSPTFIPVVHSDFVFAAVAEEWGLIGSVGIVALFAFLVMRALHIATENEPRPFHALTASGIGVTLGIQALLIMGGVLKIVPLTGVTLPFVSYGGSSMLSSFLMVGLLLRISDPGTELL
ncbi:MAG: FtsW/RodA/SpoVE family cell cycle protein [Anaerolineae bacterium]